jgi:ABC-type transport system involved in multi-copper enzyme maturation permease subunit
MYVLAGLPVLALLQLFGGIDPDLALASAAAAVLTVIGLSAVSLAFSAALKKSRDAIAVTYLMVVGYLAVSVTLAVVASGLLVPNGRHLTDFGLFVVDWQAVAEWFASGNAGYVYVTETGWGQSVDGDAIARMLGRYAAFWGLVTGLALLYAVTRLRVVALRQSYGAPRTAPARIAARRPSLGTMPVLWREVFGSGGRVGVMGWLFRTVVVGLTVAVPVVGAYVCFFDTSNRRGNPTFASRWEDYIDGMSVWVRVCTGVLTTVILFGVALRGAAAVAGERDKDTWLSLISAPLTPAEVLFGKWLGCVLSMRFAYAVLLGVWAVGLGLQVVQFGMLLLAAGLVFVYASAFSCVGIVCSLSAKTTLGASVRAFAATAFLAGGFWLLVLVCCVLPVGIVGGRGRSLETPAVLLLGGTPPFIAGWAPMRELDRAGLGPFYSDEFRGVGPMAPVLGTAFWVAATVVLASIALQMMARAMNRRGPDESAPDERPPPCGAG